MIKEPFTDSKSIETTKPIGLNYTMKLDRDNTTLTLTFKEIWENAINTLLIALGIISYFL